MQKTLNSIKNQTYKDFEVWVVDGNSGKATQEFLSNLKAPFFYQSEKDKGIYDAMNKGISLAKGEWFYFLGTDDQFYDKDVLLNIFENKTFENINIIAGKIIYEGDKKPFIYSKNKMVKDISWSSSMWIRNGLHHQGTFYKRTLFANKKYNLKYKTLSDYWFNLYLYKNKEICEIKDEVIAKCNSDGVSKSGKWEIYQEEINLKTDLSSQFFRPLFYIIALLKFLSRKIVND